MFVLAVHYMINWCSDLQTPARGQEIWRPINQTSQGGQSRNPRDPIGAWMHCAHPWVTISWAFVALAKTKDAIACLGRLKENRDMRLEQPHGSVQRLTSTCDLMPDSLTEGHGYHRECYQRFTMNFNRLSTHPKSFSSPCSKLIGFLVIIKVLHHCRIRLCCF